MQRNDTSRLGLFYALMVLAMIGWGASWVHVKYLAEHLSIHEIIFYRYGLTTLSMFPLLYVMKLSLRIDRATLFDALIAAGIMILYTWLFTPAPIWEPPGSAALSSRP